jgi:hypothetical protein
LCAHGYSSEVAREWLLYWSFQRKTSKENYVWIIDTNSGDNIFFSGFETIDHLLPIFERNVNKR